MGKVAKYYFLIEKDIFIKADVLTQEAIFYYKNGTKGIS
jgi:hypothetical protein